MERAMAVALAAERGVDPDHDLGVQLFARAATAIYVSAFHIHFHTGRQLEDLVDEGFKLIDAGLRGLPSDGLPSDGLPSDPASGRSKIKRHLVTSGGNDERIL
jgi:hypothetical protein